MKTTGLSKREAEKMLKSGKKVYLTGDKTTLVARGVLRDNFFDDKTGWNFTQWFHIHAPKTGWNVVI